MSEYQNYDDYNDPEEINEYDAIHGDPKKITVSKIIKKTITTTLKLIALNILSINNSIHCNFSFLHSLLENIEQRRHKTCKNVHLERCNA